MNKKSFLQTICSLLILCMAVSVLISCQNQSEKRHEKRLENAIEKATGEEVDIDMDEGEMKVKTKDGEIHIDGSDHSWPKEAPGDIPEFTYGDIIAVTTTKADGGHGWTIMYEDVEEDAAKKYNQELEAKGFETMLTGAVQGKNIMAEKEKTYVAVMVIEGKATLSIQIEE